jgi:salicylate hydroxylase
MDKLLVVGGGIGGLSAALACAQGGAEVHLFERSAGFTEVGAGVQLGPNVVKVLQGWGLNSALQAVAAYPDRLQVRCASSGAELGVSRLGQVFEQRYGAPYLTVHRADLHALLLEAVRQEAGVALHTHSAATRFSQTDSGVSLHLSDVLQVQGDALVGADGGWSRIRQNLLGDGVPRPTGHLAYRAMVDQAGMPPALRSEQVTAWLGPKLHVVQYPVRGGKWLNVVAIVHGQVKGDMSNWDHSANALDLQHCMEKTCAPLQDLIGAIGQWRLWPLSIRAPMRGAHEHAQGRIALLGDAAHPMVPYLAQGAGMAIEDASVLAQEFCSMAADPLHTVAQRLGRYAARRWERNARVQACAIRNGEIFHASGLMRLGRNAAMRILGEKLLDQPWLYGWSEAIKKGS